MKLSELKTGEKAVIVKVMGRGGFRKRIIEMGFVKGQMVEVLLNAPLQDPVKYKIMGYEVSLRRQEAEMIEVYWEANPKENAQEPAPIPSLKEENLDANADGKSSENHQASPSFDGLQTGKGTSDAYHEAMRQRRTISVALVVNPN